MKSDHHPFNCARQASDPIQEIVSSASNASSPTTTSDPPTLLKKKRNTEIQRFSVGRFSQRAKREIMSVRLQSVLFLRGAALHGDCCQFAPKASGPYGSMMSHLCCGSWLGVADGQGQHVRQGRNTHRDSAHLRSRPPEKMMLKYHLSRLETVLEAVSTASRDHTSCIV